MITKNFKNICATMLQSLGSSYYSVLPIKACNGTTYYANCGFYSYYPRTVTYSLSLSATGAGIVLGTGTTAPTEDDYKIETPITSDLAATVTYARGTDGSGNPYLTFTLIVSNNGSGPVTISEIAFNQTVQVANTLGNTGSTSAVACLDRTVLATPVTIASGEQKAIEYTLKTIVA